jgi:putative pyruvate formate lyase activating enzyme
MYRQVGPLQLDDRGLAVRGVLVRHLLLPMDMGQAEKVIDIVSDTAPGCSINILAQYRPAFRAAEYPELLVLPTTEQVRDARKYAKAMGLKVVQ